MKIVIAPVDGVSRHASLTSLLSYFLSFSPFIYKDCASKTQFRRFVHSSASLDVGCHRTLDGSIYPAIKKQTLSRQFVHHFCFCCNIPFPLVVHSPLHFYKFVLLFISMPLTLSLLQFIFIYSFTWLCRCQLFTSVFQFFIQSFSPVTGSLTSCSSASNYWSSSAAIRYKRPSFQRGNLLDNNNHHHSISWWDNPTIRLIDTGIFSHTSCYSSLTFKLNDQVCNGVSS